MLNQDAAHIVGPLGYIVVEFNYLEEKLGHLISALVGKGDDAALAFSLPSFSAKIEIADKVGGLCILEENRRTTLRRLLVEAKRVNRLRNQFIHGQYLMGVDLLNPDEGRVLLFASIRVDANESSLIDEGRIENRKSFYKITSEELLDAAKAIAQCAGEILAFIDDVAGLPSAS